ncbi:hypothetical protein EYF80_046610 [Liparis tanakae]|uniref:Uncharacterized protein n=1 Tax=Liparis tanakae TaxID=230148 RepID=A0A4Z2FPY0_9TELE|nr:hypothetical protein EYF80_046610 [Liparis tanakae]
MNQSGDTGKTITGTGTVDGENVYDAHKVAPVGPVDHVDRIFAVGQQPAVMLEEPLDVCVRAGPIVWGVDLLEGNPLIGTLSGCQRPSCGTGRGPPQGPAQQGSGGGGGLGGTVG